LRPGHPPHRRHIRAVPALLRPALRARFGTAREVAAVRGVLGSVLGMIRGGVIRGGATHVGVATTTSLRLPQWAMARLQRSAKGSSRTCWRSSNCWKRSCRRRAWWSGRWWSSMRTTPWRRGGHGGAGCACRARDYLNARQGSRPMRARHSRRPVGSAEAHDAR
jgi:hypothetical protein